VIILHTWSNTTAHRYRIQHQQKLKWSYETSLKTTDPRDITQNSGNTSCIHKKSQETMAVSNTLTKNHKFHNKKFQTYRLFGLPQHSRWLNSPLCDYNLLHVTTGRVENCRRFASHQMTSAPGRTDKKLPLRGAGDLNCGNLFVFEVNLVVYFIHYEYL
jgi:hypothetical protein